MSDTTDLDVGSEIPTFSQCVIGYRAWWADASHRLWPVSVRRRPWVPGTNEARCECRTAGRLRFEWTWEDGRRVLAAAPAHPAPSDECSCGLYSLRRPRSSWHGDPGLSSPPRVVGAVASWGRMQVHATGFRAEHACVVALAYHAGATSQARTQLDRIAARYGVDAVPLAELEDVARRFGAPLPDTVGPTPEPTAQTSLATHTAARPVPPAPDLTPDQLPRFRPRRTAGWNLIDPLARHRRRATLRVRARFLALEVVIAAAFIALTASTYHSQANTGFVQRQGITARGRVTSLRRATCRGPYAPSCPQTHLVVTLMTPERGVRTVEVTYPQYLVAHPGERVTLKLDPRNPRYAELARQPRSPAGIWIIAAAFAVLASAVAVADGLSLRRAHRSHRPHTDRTASRDSAA